MGHDVTPRPDELVGRGQQTGLFVAALGVPGSFAPSLMPRSAVDQGIVTGLTATLSYLMTATTQDAIEAFASTVAPYAADPGAAHRRTAAAVNLAAVPVGLAMQRLLPWRDDQTLLRGIARQLGWRLTLTACGGLAYTVLEQAGGLVADRIGVDPRRLAAWLAAPVGLAAGVAIESRRDRAVGPVEAPALLPSAATAAGVSGALTALAFVESYAARSSGTLLARGLPGSPQVWRLTGHAATLALLGAGAYALWDRAMQRIEAGTTEIEPLFTSPEVRRVVTPAVSGGPGSAVHWDTLGREGRRHVAATVHGRSEPDRPASIPDLSIETVTQQPPVADPVAIFIGLDSAATVEQRVELALAELERTGAFDRSLLVLISPTGTGYVNYVATAAIAYLTRGDVATVTMQYSKRPSPLSLGKIRAAREQNRLLWLSILRRLHNQEGRRPRVVVFGESLGAHTSQDVFMHWGTIGPAALGIDRALWIGTPAASKWMQQVTGAHRPGIDADEVAVVNDFGQIRALSPERRERLRYVMVSHDNDGVTKFSADLLVLEPAWLRQPRPPVEQVPDASPRGIPGHMRWRPLTTFFQTFIDMKNAQVPGKYKASGHDYRPDLVRFLSEVYGLPATEAELVRIERAVEQREEFLEAIFTAGSLDPGSVNSDSEK